MEKTRKQLQGGQYLNIKLEDCQPALKLEYTEKSPEKVYKLVKPKPTKKSKEELDEQTIFSKNALKYRWLTGPEYHYILTNFDKLKEEHKFKVYDDSHPKWIYTRPKNGAVYFIKHLKLETLNFKRIMGLQKQYKWKKMNFPTFMPKHKAKVMYLVATSKEQGVCFRMHIVQLTSLTNEMTKSIVSMENSLTLCHMLQIESDSYQFTNGYKRRKIPKPIMQTYDACSDSETLDIDDMEAIEDPQEGLKTNKKRKPLKDISNLKGSKNVVKGGIKKQFRGWGQTKKLCVKQEYVEQYNGDLFGGEDQGLNGISSEKVVRKEGDGKNICKKEFEESSREESESVGGRSSLSTASRGEWAEKVQVRVIGQEERQLIDGSSEQRSQEVSEPRIYSFCGNGELKGVRWSDGGAIVKKEEEGQVEGNQVKEKENVENFVANMSYERRLGAEDRKKKESTVLRGYMFDVYENRSSYSSRSIRF